MQQIRLAVRQLVEFLLQTGDIDSRFTGFDRANEGARIHRRLQKQAGDGYRPEVFLSETRELEGIRCTVEGRADGIFEGAEGQTVIDEIKTTDIPADQITEDLNFCHWAQGMVYAAICAAQNDLDSLDVRLTYCQIGDDKIIYFTRHFQRDALEDFFLQLLKDYLPWAQRQLQWAERRRDSLAALRFPYKSYRPGQRALAGEVYRACRTGREGDKRGFRLFCQAPTGTGKTMSALFPAMKAMGEGIGEKLFYFTARTTARAAAESAVELLRTANPGLSFRSITLTAKEKVCLCKNDAGRPVCIPEACPYAKGYYDRLKSALAFLLDGGGQLDRPALEAAARRFTVCPFELGLDLSIWCDLIIGDYNYLFDPTVHLRRFFEAAGEWVFLIDEAHKKGIAVIMDIVHSHAVKNEVEGLGRFDGSYNQYFYGDHRREHPAWDSLCFDYGKNEVIHFLLSNCKYWLDEFRFDGFRFDGVTSMLYYNHGLGQAFGSYDDYYNGGQDDNAIVYLSLANELIHQVNPRAITIAEEMSGMPGLATKFKDGGIGFDYRMAMGIPDFWIKTIKEKKDEDWKPTAIFWELTNRRADEKTINYAESHDQALVGDKTIIFRLIDDVMYWHMSKGDSNMTVDRGMSLHKMIRLVTLSTINGGYLNFMGNEFGHPEWIDFPRQGNGWSYKYARRQWDLVDREDLKYQYLGAFDQAIIHLVGQQKKFEQTPIVKLCENDGDQVLAFLRDDLLFVFNFHPFKSFNGYGILAPKGEYEPVLSSDDAAFGGYNLVDMTVNHHTQFDPLFEKEKKEWLMLYLPARTAQILRWKKPQAAATKDKAKAAKAESPAKKTEETKKRKAKK